VWTPTDAARREGYVVRTRAGFTYREFRHRVFKFVRPDHVHPTAHWFHGQPVTRNQLGSRGD
jgi:hypothetical protein